MGRVDACGRVDIAGWTCGYLDACGHVDAGMRGSMDARGREAAWTREDLWRCKLPIFHRNPVCFIVSFFFPISLSFLVKPRPTPSFSLNAIHENCSELLVIILPVLTVL